LAIDDPLWKHRGSWWLFDMTMLVLLGVVIVGVVRYRLRLPTHAQRRAGGPVAGPPERTLLGRRREDD
jgi:hypothetical protein